MESTAAALEAWNSSSQVVSSLDNSLNLSDGSEIRYMSGWRQAEGNYPIVSQQLLAAEAVRGFDVPRTNSSEMLREMHSGMINPKSSPRTTPSEQAISPSFASMFNSRLNLKDMVIQEGDESADVSGPGLETGQPATNTGRASTEEDIFSSLGGMELGQEAERNQYLGNQPNTAPPLPNTSAPPALGGMLVGNMPLGTDQSRTLFVRNVDESVADDEIHGLFEQYGEIRTLYTACKQRGFVMISFYDIRAACLAVHVLNGSTVKGRSLDIQFAVQKDNEKELLQGCVLVFVSDAALTNEELWKVFSHYGEVKSIIDHPGKANHKVVEYFDVRHASQALRSLNRTDVARKLVVFEPTSPLHGSPKESWVQPKAQVEYPQQRMSHAVSSDALGGPQMFGREAANAIPRGLLRNLSDGNLAQAQAVEDLLLSGMGLSNSLSQESLTNAYGSQAANRLMTSLSSGNLAGSLQRLRQGMPNSDSVGSNLYNAQHMGSSNEPHLVNEALQAGLLRRPNPNLPLSMSTGDLAALASGRMGGLRSMASTGSLWNAAQQVLANQPSGGQGGAGGMWSGSMPNLQAAGTVPNWALQEAALLNQQASGIGLGLQQTPSMENLMAAGLQSLQGPQLNSLTQQLLQQAVAQNLQTQPGNYPLAALANRHTNVKERRDDGGLGGPGGRLSRRNMDPVAEAERKAQQDKLYALDLDKILHGHDKRTTLMIKNIPNKYTQKMLLGTIDEKFKGTYDFFYLPIDFKNKCNVGYAFINLIQPQYIIPLVERFNNKKWEKFNSEKVCCISYARIQGKQALIAHFQNSSLLHEDKRCRPILFHSEGPFAGDQEPFPMKPNPRLRTSRVPGRDGKQREREGVW